MARRCLVLGSAKCLWDDVNAALDISEFDGVVAAKHAGVVWPGKLDAWVSLHPERFGQIIAQRKAAGFPPAPRLFGHERATPRQGLELTQYRFEGQKTSGSSGLFAAKVALEDLGYDRAVLCGIPLTKSDGRLDNVALWHGAVAIFQAGFNEALPRINHRLCSMSGWTMHLLGRPTAKWLDGGTKDGCPEF